MQDLKPDTLGDDVLRVLSDLGREAGEAVQMKTPAERPNDVAPLC